MRTIKIVAAVALDKLADVIDALDKIGVVAQITSGAELSAEPEPEPLQTTAAARNARNARILTATAERLAAEPGRKSPAPRASNVGKRVLYTPAVTARQIDAMLAKLDKGTMRAVMLSAVAKSGRDGIAKSDLRQIAERRKMNPESVDNVIWKLQTAGVIKSVAAE